ncbi:MAG: hydrogen peroxide-inducible genes activator [Gammaproteobacteria bacterium]|nr:hydrogen peroxide-inducible genes activator [Gammaproteobacteria bacterium]NND59419.1 hydrogen peroxide-inducible genes activator [Gammaproteobacteria bacterium]
MKPRSRYPTVKQLRYFTALDEHEHFGRAAAACFVSQSAFSVAIKELEALLGASLVDRTNKQVTITATGKEIATQARLVLRDIDMLVEIAGAEREPLTGRLRLGIIPTIAPFLLPTMLPALRKGYPKLQLYLREDLTDRVYERMMDGELDLVLIALPYELRGVETQTLFRDPFYLACRQGSELVDPDNYAFNRLQAESVLLLEDGHCLRDHALAACRLRNLDKISQFSATSLQTLVQMVDNDLGITYLPEMARGSALLRGTRVRMHPLSRGSYREVGLAWRRGSARAEEFRELGKFIAKAIV